ncbi:MAG TPA: response regulator transcription factor, partial [Allosphingosinicella sp.]|nr:response regulator transcription factor [Allosphingosinicella sp.]
MTGHIAARSPSTLPERDRGLRPRHSCGRSNESLRSPEKKCGSRPYTSRNPGGGDLSHTKLIIADDHPLFRGALRGAIEAFMPGCAIREASGLEDLNTLLADERDVDLLLLDLAMPGAQGFSGLIYLRAQFPDVPIVVVSASEEPVVIRRAVEFGASGFIP